MCRSTVRTALIRLQAENLIDIVPRGGVFIRSSAPKVMMGASSLPLNQGPELQQVSAFIHTMRKQGREILIRYLEPSSILPAGEEIGKKMGINTTTSVVNVTEFS